MAIDLRLCLENYKLANELGVGTHQNQFHDVHTILSDSYLHLFRLQIFVDFFFKFDFSNRY